MIDKPVEERIRLLRPNEKYLTTRIRALCREAFELALPNIASIAKGESDAPPHAQIRALETLGKYGLGECDKLLIEDEEACGLFYLNAARHFADRDKFIAFAADMQNTLQFGPIVDEPNQ